MDEVIGMTSGYGCRKRRKSGKISRDRNRDVSKKVALGMASTSRGGEVMMYDQRLFNQDKGMGSGFATTDDAYNIYDKGLFTAQPTLSTLYRPKKDVDSDVYDEKQQTEKIIKTDRFKPDTTFVGTSERAGPVEFEADPFGLDQLWREKFQNSEGSPKFCKSVHQASALVFLLDGHVLAVKQHIDLEHHQPQSRCY
ncbi:hypothetical protein HAX54_044355 [Datura stramonium]|uniref:Uncharacterized protein n=1 Tax=Datura stramonium TaxID=4076 RepID=A0ABS8W4M8_DATST|nr:hypothetical protein [Datura stramonium]